MTELLTPEETLTRWSDELRASVPPCPPWCTLPAGHPWDEDAPHAVPAREHRGPDFGPLLQARGLERASDRGRVVVGIMVDDYEFRNHDARTVVELLELATYAAEAARWLAEVQAS